MRTDQERKKPISQNDVHHPIGELGNFIHERGSHIVTQIRVAHAAVRVAVIGILVRVAAGADPIVKCFRILQTMRISVNGKQREVVREAVLSR